jgi:hypothetical protein
MGGYVGQKAGFVGQMGGYVGQLVAYWLIVAGHIGGQFGWKSDWVCDMD